MEDNQGKENVENTAVESMIPDIYVNGASVISSTFDFYIDFIKETLSGDGTPGSQEVVAKIRMSPQLAKSLVKILTNNINEYELKNGGEINLPDAIKNMQ